jgi:hypothetical protein
MQMKARGDWRAGVLRCLLTAFALATAATPLYAVWYEVGGDTGDVQVSILYGNWMSTTFEVFVPGMEVTPESVEGEVFNHVVIPGARSAGLADGRPELPRVNITLAIPLDADTVTVNVSQRETVCFNVPKVYPLQPEGTSELDQFYVDRDFYTKDTVYPGYDQTHASPADWRDLRLIRIEVYPVQVNPDRETVVVASRLRVTVNHPGTFMTWVVPVWFAPLCANLVDNYDCLGITAQPDDDEPGARCLVFLPPKYANNVWLVDSLLGWMYKRGYQWDTVQLASANPTSIKQRIKTEYESHTPHVLRWVLLVGDVESIPSPGFTKDIQHGGWSRDDSVGACDHWYADWCEALPLDSCDDFAEVGISRLSVADTADLTQQAEKIVGYAKRPDAGQWLQNLTMVAHKAITGKNFSGFVRDLATLIDDSCGYFKPDKDTILGINDGVYNDDVIDSVNGGTGVVLYAGEGRSYRWLQWNQHNEDWTCNDVFSLANGGWTPVVLTVACSTGCILKDTCLAEAWMRKSSGGAVASLGCSIKSMGTTGHENPSKAVCSTLVRALYQGSDSALGYGRPVLDLGSIMMYMNAHMATYYPDGKYKATTRNIYSYLALGDPTMKVWSGGVPETANVTHPFWVPLASQSVDVSVRLSTGPAVSGARVCLSKSNEVYATGLTDASGDLTLSIDPTSSGWMDITVSEGHAHTFPHTPILPYQGKIAVGLTGWLEATPMPYPPSGRKIRAGGWLTTDTSANVVYAAKGNYRGDFYRFAPDSGGWMRRKLIKEGPSRKMPRAGCRGAADGQGNVYMVKGNNTREFWRYDIAEDSWYQLPDVPPGDFRTRVKTGSDLVYAQVGDTGFVYLLRGYSQDFVRFRVQGESGAWEACTRLPSAFYVRKGDWLVFDGDHTIYAHNARHRQLWVYNISTGLWSNLPRPGIPLGPRNKRAGDGSCGAWYDGSIYALKGLGRQEFWRYDPGGDTWHELDDMPLPAIKKRVKDGADISAMPGYGLYATNGHNMNTFWLYKPSSPGSMMANAPGREHAIAGAGGPTLGGELPLMDGLDASKPRWNWQGTMVCYSKTDTLTERRQIYQCQYGASGPEQRVVDMDEDCEEPVYSPDGLFIAFQLDDTVSGFYQLCVTSSDTGIGGGGVLSGRGAAVSACNAADRRVPTVAPNTVARLQAPVAQSKADGRRATCAAPVVPGGPASLGLVWQITSAEADHCYPEWSPDGMWLCYERDDENGYIQIWRVPALGGTEQQLTFDNADHLAPSYLSQSEIVFTLSPDYGYDQIAKLNLSTLQVSVLSQFQTDHDRPNPSWNGLAVASEAVDDSGNTHIVRIAGSGGTETWLTSGTSDITEPDYGQDNQSIFAVRWAGSLSQIVWVDGWYGGYTAVTDSLAIRDNPDTYVDSFVSNSSAVYEREEWMPGGVLLGGGGRRRYRTGVYLSMFRKRPHYFDGVQGVSLGVLALDNARPNPAQNRVTIRWQVPVEADVSLRVYNTAGQLVRVLADGKCKPGAYTSVWNRTDAKGHRLANGVYFYELDSGERRISRKVILTE